MSLNISFTQQTNSMNKDAQNTTRIGKSALSSVRASLKDGVVTPAHSTHREAIANFPNDSLAGGLVGELRCKRHHFMTTGLSFLTIADKFLAHSNRQPTHTDRIPERVVQLGDKPDFSLSNQLKCRHLKYSESNNPKTMIRVSLIAKSIDLKTCHPRIEVAGKKYTATRHTLGSSATGSKNKHSAAFEGG